MQLKLRSFEGGQRMSPPNDTGATVQVTAQVEKVIHAPTSTVWAALTTPALIKKYFFGADAKSDWKPGSPIRWRGEFRGKRYEDKGEVLVVKPGKELSMSHWSALSGDTDSPENYHVVTYHLEPQGGGHTRVILTQSNLVGG